MDNTNFSGCKRLIEEPTSTSLYDYMQLLAADESRQNYHLDETPNSPN